MGALTSRVWIEQAKGVLLATQGLSPDEAFGQLRRQARASSRKLAALAQAVVQDAQRERLAALAVDDARVREAEVRAQAAEQALQAAQVDLAQRRRRSTRPKSRPRSATALLPGATLPPTSASGSLTSVSWPPMTVI